MEKRGKTEDAGPDVACICTCPLRHVFAPPAFSRHLSPHLVAKGTLLKVEKVWGEVGGGGAELGRGWG